MTSAPHFEFQTPAVDRRDPQTITLSLCGETLTVDRPKQWTLGQAKVIDDDSIPLQQRGQALAEFVTGSFDSDGWERLVARAADRSDPLNLASYTDAVNAMVSRWAEWDNTPQPHTPITIEPRGGNGLLGEPVTVSYPALDLEMVHVEPPKDLFVLAMYAVASRGSGSGALWVVDQMMANTFPADAYEHIMSRLHDRSDSVDVEHIDPMFSQLLEHWTSHMDTSTPAAPANRAERRANGGAHAASTTGTLSGTLQ